MTAGLAAGLAIHRVSGLAGGPSAPTFPAVR
jgi:hypothetical protein